MLAKPKAVNTGPKITISKAASKEKLKVRKLRSKQPMMDSFKNRRNIHAGRNLMDSHQSRLNKINSNLDKYIY